ncbi:unnamed protein product [Boreogadus saida]
MEDEDRGTAPPRDGSATGTRPKAATSKPSTPVVEDRTDRLERIVKSVVGYQRRQHDQAEAEFFRQDQRTCSEMDIPEVLTKDQLLRLRWCWNSPGMLNTDLQAFQKDVLILGHHNMTENTIPAAQQEPRDLPGKDLFKL